jgi:hypothetical protein
MVMDMEGRVIRPHMREVLHSEFVENLRVIKRLKQSWPYFCQPQNQLATVICN